MTASITRFSLAAAVLLATSACGGGGAKTTPDPATDDHKTLYTLGRLIGRNLPSFNLTPEEAEIVARGVYDAAVDKDPVVPMQEWQGKVQQLSMARMQARAAEMKEKAKPFLEAAAKEEGAEKTATGLIYKSITEGMGASPTATDKVKVNYRGTLTDGTEFDSSYKRNQPAEFFVNRVVRCWTEGLQKMKTGGKAKLTCPADIAYGDRGNPPDIPGGATLVFEVELLEVLPPPPPPAPGTTPAGPGMPKIIPRPKLQ